MRWAPELNPIISPKKACVLNRSTIRRSFNGGYIPEFEIILKTTHETLGKIGIRLYLFGNGNIGIGTHRDTFCFELYSQKIRFFY